MEALVTFIDRALMNADAESMLVAIAGEVKDFMQQFPLYPGMT
jgi:glycine/serine hydroxymethyltransferase